MSNQFSGLDLSQNKTSFPISDAIPGVYLAGAEYMEKTSENGPWSAVRFNFENKEHKGSNMIFTVDKKVLAEKVKSWEIDLEEGETRADAEARMVESKVIQFGRSLNYILEVYSDIGYTFGKVKTLTEDLKGFVSAVNAYVTPLIEDGSIEKFYLKTMPAKGKDKQFNGFSEPAKYNYLTSTPAEYSKKQQLIVDEQNGLGKSNVQKDVVDPFA